MRTGMTRGFLCRSRLVWALLIAVAAGCAQMPALSPPGESNRTVVASQWLQLKTAGQQAEAICLVELNHEALRLVAITPQGQTLLKATLKADGSLESETSPLIAASGMESDAIVRDLQIALWPVKALRKHGWDVQETDGGHRRILALDGTHWATVTYTGELQRPQQILIERGNGLYSVELRTLEWTSP